MTVLQFLRRAIDFALISSLILASGAARAEIKVGFSDWPGWVAWVIAEQQGFFKKHGANVKLVWFPNYSDSISALSSGQLDANCQTWSDTMAPLAKGIPLKVVLVNDNSAGNDAVMAVIEVQEHQGPQGQDRRTRGIQRLALRAGDRALAKRHDAQGREDRQPVRG